MAPPRSANAGDEEHRRDDAGPASGHGGRRGSGYDPRRSGRSVSYTAGYAGAAPRAPAPAGEVVFSTASGDVVAQPSERRSYPSRKMLSDASTHRLGDVRRVLSKAPWWDTDGIRDKQLVAFYEDADGMLPHGLPGSIVESFDFRRRCLAPSKDLLPGNADKSARVRHIMDVYARFMRMPCAEPITAEYGVDLYCHRTLGEVDYVEQLRCLRVERWEGIRDVAQEALCFVRPLLRADFRYERKADSPYWTWAKWERRMRKNDGVLACYHQVEYQSFRPEKRIGRYPRTPPFFEEIEVPTHCYVDMAPIVAYKGSELMRNIFSGWWLVFNTEWVTKVACFILWDVYDRHQLWRLSALLMEWMRRLDLSDALGSKMNEGELHFLLGVIASTDWTTGEVVDTNEQQTRQDRVHYTPSGVRSVGANATDDKEFIFYDPWRRVRLEKGEAFTLRKRANRRPKPDGHPAGFIYNPPLPPKTVEDLSWAPADVPVIPASHFYEEEDGEAVYVGPPMNQRSGMELERPPEKRRRRGGARKVGSAGSSAAHAAQSRSDAPQRGGIGPRREAGQTPTELEIELATGEYLGQLGVAPGESSEALKADIKALIRQRMSQGAAEAASASAAPAVGPSEGVANPSSTDVDATMSEARTGAAEQPPAPGAQ